MKKIFNPLISDFSYEWLDDNDCIHLITLRAMDFTELSDAQATFMARHLADKVFQERGSTKMDREEQMKKILEEIL